MNWFHCINIPKIQKVKGFRIEHFGIKCMCLLSLFHYIISENKKMLLLQLLNSSQVSERFFLLNARGAIVQMFCLVFHSYMEPLTCDLVTSNKLIFHYRCASLWLIFIPPGISVSWRPKAMTHVVPRTLRRPHLYSLRVWQHIWLTPISPGSMCFGWSLCRNATSGNPLGDLEGHSRFP